MATCLRVLGAVGTDTRPFVVLWIRLVLRVLLQKFLIALALDPAVLRVLLMTSLCVARVPLSEVT